MSFPFGKFFGEIRILGDLQFRDGVKPFEDAPPRDPEPKDLLLYLGCNVLRTAHLVSTVTAVLKAMGFDFNAVGGPAYCCGIIHHMNGAREASRGYTAGTLRHFAAYRPQKVIMWCPSCNEHYDDVVKQEHDVTFPYEHVTAFIARHLDRVNFVQPVARKVALHYHTGHPQQDLDWASTRRILRAIPGLDYVEIDNPGALGRHCSSRYINALGRPAWQAHVTRVSKAAAAAGVDVLATVYHSCQREICDQEGRYPFAVINYVTLLAEAMGLPPEEDWFKRQRLAADPEATFAEIQPWVEARGLDANRVKDVLTKSFAPACETRLPNPS